MRGPDGIYFAWAVFEDYAAKGSLICRKIVEHALHLLLPEPTLTTNLPAQGITTLTEQPGLNRYVHHLLYASPVRRGDSIEVIEDLIPLADVHVSLRLPRPVSRVLLAPQGTALPFTQDAEKVSYVLPRLECHQMVVLNA